MFFGDNDTTWGFVQYRQCLADDSSGTLLMINSLSATMDAESRPKNIEMADVHITRFFKSGDMEYFNKTQNTERFYLLLINHHVIFCSVCLQPDS